MRRERRPDGQVMAIALFGFALQDGQVGQQQIAQRPLQTLFHLRRIPVRDNPHRQSPLSQILSAALAPAPTLQFWREDFREVAANAVAY